MPEQWLSFRPATSGHVIYVPYRLKVTDAFDCVYGITGMRSCEDGRVERVIPLFGGGP